MSIFVPFGIFPLCVRSPFVVNLGLMTIETDALTNFDSFLHLTRTFKKTYVTICTFLVPHTFEKNGKISIYLGVIKNIANVAQ